MSAYNVARSEPYPATSPAIGTSPRVNPPKSNPKEIISAQSAAPRENPSFASLRLYGFVGSVIYPEICSI